MLDFTNNKYIERIEELVAERSESIRKTRREEGLRISWREKSQVAKGWCKTKTYKDFNKGISQPSGLIALS
jgi:hypothetical protein